MASPVRTESRQNCEIFVMNSMEDESSDPRWILEDTEGVLYWRRENISQRRSRVTFRHSVQVMEFERYPHEQEANRSIGTSLIGISISCLLCVLITTVLPWYLLLGS